MIWRHWYTLTCRKTYTTCSNLLDGVFFGMAIGFASFVTVFPLFVSTITGSGMRTALNYIRLLLAAQERTHLAGIANRQA